MGEQLDPCRYLLITHGLCLWQESVCSGLPLRQLGRSGPANRVRGSRGSQEGEAGD